MKLHLNQSEPIMRIVVNDLWLHDDPEAYCQNQSSIFKWQIKHMGHGMVFHFRIMIVFCVSLRIMIVNLATEMTEKNEYNVRNMNRMMKTVNIFIKVNKLYTVRKKAVESSLYRQRFHPNWPIVHKRQHGYLNMSHLIFSRLIVWKYGLGKQFNNNQQNCDSRHNNSPSTEGGSI